MNGSFYYLTNTVEFFAETGLEWVYDRLRSTNNLPTLLAPDYNNVMDTILSAVSELAKSS